MGSTPATDDSAQARRILARCLERRDHTRAELATALSRRGISPETSEVALDRFGELGLVDDGAFARRWVSIRGVSGGRSARALVQELRMRGVGADEVAQALDEYGLQEQAETALRVANRFAAAARRRGDDPGQARRKVIQALGRRGFPPSICLRAASLALLVSGNEAAGADADASADTGWVDSGE